MCNRYKPPPHVRDIELTWEISRQHPGDGRWWDEVLHPRGQGPVIRRARNDAGYSRELLVGQWGLIPWFAREAKLKYPTVDTWLAGTVTEASKLLRLAPVEVYDAGPVEA